MASGVPRLRMLPKYTVQVQQPRSLSKHYPAQNVKSAEGENPDAKTSPSYKLKTAFTEQGPCKK